MQTAVEFVLIFRCLPCPEILFFVLFCFNSFVLKLFLFRQIEDLLAEKKSMFLQLQKTMDDSDAAKGNSEQLQREIADTKSLLNKRQNELQLLRGL